MRKGIAISLILLFVISQAGYYFHYTLQREQLRTEMKKQLLANMPDDTLELICQEDNDIRWEEQDKEFYLNGRLFDVARIEKINGKTWLYCIGDKKEHQLVQDMAKLAGSSGDANTGGVTAKHTLKFQLNDYIVHSIEKIIYTRLFHHQQYFNFDESVSSVVAEVNAPPPRA